MNENTLMRVPRRRWFRFSLRTLLLLVTVLGVWLGLHMQAVRRQKESIAAIKNIGGWCYYDFQDRSAQQLEPDLAATSPLPGWLCNLFGNDFFHNITDINLVYEESAPGKRQENDRGTGEDLKCLSGFPRLKQLALSRNQASDTGLFYIGQLKHLESLVIWDAILVSDAGVAHLSNLGQLRFIHLSNSKITDDSLKTFAAMPSLEGLSLQENHFTDRGLVYLSQMTQLKSLSVGLGDVKGITDEGLVHLKGLKNLEDLDLQGAGVTTAGLEHLRGLKKLKELWAPVDDVSSLQAALPKCQINSTSPVTDDE